MIQTMLSIVLLGFMTSCASPGDMPNGSDFSPAAASDRAGHAAISVLTVPTVIPDGDPGGILMGPLRVGIEDQVLRGVVLCLQIEHDYVGDLSIRLYYDSNGDGIFEASTPIEIYLARVGGKDSEELWAYPLELHGTYFFKDEGWGAAGEEASLHDFDGLPAGGCFYLSVTDSKVGDTGTVLGWSISVEDAL